ncbi:RNA-binding protein [Dolichospermum sp. FACHB-1091]|uniref:RNA recognition motif domain-containing protein n=1 Tax=Dolichospermum sp. FACHB-1091 TaxID=2692798 RepID=UPI001680AE84|nr:RNA-binding protein [Dolichospermum sp. FACHB-1091]MBD2443021.1 RNA-binding protein [Dolichospermum sp. FACHB-1091]
MTIYVGNLSYQVTEDDLKRAFAEYGTVGRVQLPTDRETGRPRGFAFVDMEKETEEAAAIEALDGAEWMGRDLKVNKAKPREERNPSRGGGGGGWGGNRGGGGDRDRSGGGGDRDRSGGGGRRY